MSLSIPIGPTSVTINRDDRFVVYAPDATISFRAEEGFFARAELDRPADAARLRREADTLFQRFNEPFWWEAEGTYDLGLNGRKEPIETVASNAAHRLSSGIVPPDRARRLVDRLMAPHIWSGWGIRTLSSDHPAYNPFSYHTGSVWPHTTTRSSPAGSATTGSTRRPPRSLAASSMRPSGSWPTVCRSCSRGCRDGSFPVQYLEANVPQAWASGAIFRLVAILCGIDATSDAHGSRLYLHPALPGWLSELTMRNLRAGRGALDLRFHDGDVEVLQNTSGFEVVHGPPPPIEPSSEPSARRAG